jgi:hypothetical protein
VGLAIMLAEDVGPKEGERCQKRGKGVLCDYWCIHPHFCLTFSFFAPIAIYFPVPEIDKKIKKQPLV